MTPPRRLAPLYAALLLGLSACAATPPQPQQACWEGPAPSCLPPTSAGQAAAAQSAEAAGPFDNSSHAYVSNPK